MVAVIAQYLADVTSEINLLRSRYRYVYEYETSAEKVTPDWQGKTNRRIRVVTTDVQYTGSNKDPIVSTSYEYL